MAAAPSVIWDEFPAVMSGAVSGSQLWAGGSPAIASIEPFRRIPSSASRWAPVNDPSSALIGTGIASAANRPAVPGRGRPPVALERVRVHLLPADLPPVGQHLGHPELRPQPAVDLLEERRRERPGPAPGVGGQRHPAHRLDPAGHHQVVVAGLDPGGGEVHRLLGRAALPVDGGGRHALGQAGGHPRVAGDVGALLPHLGDAPADDVVDWSRVDPGALDQRAQGEAQQVGRVPVGQGPSPLPHGRPDHVDDDRVTFAVAHAGSCSCSRRRSRPSCVPRSRDPRPPPSAPSALPRFRAAAGREAGSAGAGRRPAPRGLHHGPITAGRHHFLDRRQGARRPARRRPPSRARGPPPSRPGRAPGPPVAPPPAAPSRPG